MAIPDTTQNGTPFPTRTRTGIIFRAGSYGAKGSYTPDDLKAMEGTEPLPINSEHRNSLFDGKLGTLQRRFTGHDDKGELVLFGEWQEPEPLALLLGDTVRRASIEIDKKTKQPVGLALTHNPHITDAAFFSAVEEAYAQFSKGEEVTPLETVNFAYESTSERDLIPEEDFGDPTNKLFPVRTQEELRQATSELAYADDPTAVKKRIIAIAERKGLKFTQPSWHQTRGVSKPITDADSTYMYSQENTDMSAKETPTQSAPAHEVPQLDLKAIPALFSKASPDELKAVADALKTAQNGGKTPRELELEEKLAKFEKDREQERLDAIAKSAEVEADKLITEKKILPTDKENVVAAFTVAGRVDAQRTELAFFSSDSPVADFSLTDHLKALYADKVEHDKDKEKTGGLSEDQIAAFDRKETTSAAKKTGDMDKGVKAGTPSYYKPGAKKKSNP